MILLVQSSFWFRFRCIIQFLPLWSVNDRAEAEFKIVVAKYYSNNYVSPANVSLDIGFSEIDLLLLEFFNLCCRKYEIVAIKSLTSGQCCVTFFPCLFNTRQENITKATAANNTPAPDKIIPQILKYLKQALH